jgi:hypothetical protein
MIISRGTLIASDTIGLTFQHNRTTSLKATDDTLRHEAEYAQSWYDNITAEMFG